MAVGDAGAAKGLTIYPATQAHSNGNVNDNQRADDIAAEIDARVAADALKLNASKIRVTATAMTAGTAAVGDLRFW
jgi:hypothetical protein